MKRNIILISIAIIVLVLIMLVVLLIHIKKINSVNEQNISMEKSDKDAIKEKMVVDSYDDFYSVMGAINKYLVYSEEKNNEAVYKLLDKNYIQENKITEKNIFEKIKNLDKTELLIKKMYYKEKNEYNDEYYVEAYIYEYNEKEYDNTYNGDIKREYEDLRLIVNLDKYNNTFSIIPEE